MTYEIKTPIVNGNCQGVTGVQKRMGKEGRKKASKIEVAFDVVWVLENYQKESNASTD